MKAGYPLHYLALTVRPFPAAVRIEIPADPDVAASRFLGEFYEVLLLGHRIGRGQMSAMLSAVVFRFAPGQGPVEKCVLVALEFARCNF